MSSIAARRIEQRSLDTAASAAYGELHRRYSVPMTERDAPLARFYALQSLVRPVIEDAYAAMQPSMDRVTAVDAYAFGIAALDCVTPERLEAVPVNGYRPKLQVCNASASARERVILGEVLTQYAQKGDVEPLLASFYRAATQVVERLPAEFRTATERQPIAIGDNVYRGLALSRLHAAPPQAVLAGGVERVVGNQELIIGGRRILRTLLHYNPETGRNPLLDAGDVLPVASLTYGPSGTGKTFTWELLFQEAEETAHRLGLAPLNRLMIDNAGKTDMVNSGRQALDEVFAQAAKRDQVHFILGDEIDSVIYGPEQTKNHVEEAKIEGAFLTGLSLWERARTGNVHGAFITNHYSRITPRVRNRMREAVFEARGPVTPEEHAQLLMQELQGFADYGLLAIADPLALGRFSVAIGNEGRDLKNIAMIIQQRYGGDPSFDPSLPLWESEINPCRDVASIREERRALGTVVDDACGFEVMGLYRQGLDEDKAAARKARIDKAVEEYRIATEVKRRNDEE